MQSEPLRLPIAPIATASLGINSAPLVVAPSAVPSVKGGERSGLGPRPLPPTTSTGPTTSIGAGREVQDPAVPWRASDEALAAIRSGVARVGGALAPLRSAVQWAQPAPYPDPTTPGLLESGCAPVMQSASAYRPITPGLLERTTSASSCVSDVSRGPSHMALTVAPTPSLIRNVSAGTPALARTVSAGSTLTPSRKPSYVALSVGPTPRSSTNTPSAAGFFV